jgi:predicted phosphodiesterase/biotin operon repressor
MDDLTSQIVKLKKEGATWRQIADSLGIKKEAARARYRRWCKTDGIVALEQSNEFYGIQSSVIVDLLRREPHTTREISQALDRSEETVERIIAAMIAAGYGIERDERRIILPSKPSVPPKTESLFPVGETVDVCFGVVSDTHAASNAEQVTALHDFVDVAYNEYGVKDILHAGDAFAGWGVYRGQQTEIYAAKGEEQAEVVANNLPKKSGLRWYLLGGNHDYSFFRLAGLDARKYLASNGRDDITLLPYDEADVPILPGIDARMRHPSGGIPYALSYRGQKGAEQIAQDELMRVVMGEKPTPTIRLVIIGHLHVMYMFDHGPIVVLGAGCFEGRNSYLKRKGLVPHIGGWILRCRFVDEMLHRIDMVRIRYREIEDDWRSWWVKRQAKREDIEIMEPIFSLREANER